MTRDKGPKAKADNVRHGRLSERLRDNLARRKAQARARRSGEPDERDEGIGAAAKETDEPTPDRA